MRFSIISFLALAAGAFAQSSANAFNLPTGTLVFTAGQSKTLTWSNQQGKTVTLKLRTGANSDLKDVYTIAANYPNSGSYEWTPPADTVEGANYAIEIINDDDPSETNYTGQFVIQSSNKAVPSGSASASGSATATDSASASGSASATGSSTGSATGSATASGMTTHTGSASSTGSASASATSHAATTTSAAAATVPTNAAAKPAVGAVGGLLAVAAGFAIAL